MRCSGLLRILLIITACFAAAAGGCSNGSKTARINSGKIFAVTAEKTPFYRYGPQQGNGADEQLPKDTLVTLIRPSFGYSKVQLIKGAQEGYVASEDIRPASPTLLASLNPPVESASSSGAEHFDMQSMDPNYVPPLPDPDLPPVSEEPPPTP